VSAKIALMDSTKPYCADQTSDSYINSERRARKLRNQASNTHRSLPLGSARESAQSKIDLPFSALEVFGIFLSEVP
jgi:hypothetical protein